MKRTGKTILSVLLACLMLALPFCGVFAFAEGDDGYNWVPIPGSPDGLADGECYLDWTDFLTETTADDNPTPEQLAAMIEIYNGGTWFIDYTHAKLKGTLTIPAELSDSGEEEIEEYPIEGASAALYFVIKEVGAEWIPVAKSTEGLRTGDYYIDWDSLTPEQVSFLEDGSLYYNPGSTYMELMFTPDSLQYLYYPLNKDVIGYLVGDLEILEYTGPSPSNWLPIPTSPDGLENGEFYLDWSYDFYVWSPAVRNARLAMFNSGAWYVDHANHAIKGSFVVPAEMSDTGESYVHTIDPSTELYGAALRAKGDYTQVPLSADGLNPGDFYFDFSALQAEGAEDNDILLVGVWSVDFSNYNLMVQLYQTADGVSFPAYTMFIGKNAAYLNCLREVGAQWTAVKKSTEALSDGDWYVDVSGAAAVGLSMLETADFYINPAGTLIRYKIVVHQNADDMEIYLPLLDENFGSWLNVCPIRQYSAPQHDHENTIETPEIAATADAHGYTAGVYCEDCGTWISGHEVIHNTLGARTYLDEYTEDGEQMVIIYCTVCGEYGLYAMEPVSQEEPPAEEEDTSVIGRLRKAVRSFIDFILRLLKWFSND